MQILTTKSDDRNEGHIVLLFGLGLIGRAIRDGLLRHDYRVIANIEFDWDSQIQRSGAFTKIVKSFRTKQHSEETRLTVLWSAGASGFHATREQLKKENAPFLELLQFVLQLQHETSEIPIDFHFISSAGGLFEGQRSVGQNSTPKPRRPYGELKLEQERLLLDTLDGCHVAIYRPSSVYGAMVPKLLQGLINNLVDNGRKGRVTTLDANIMALRDYVYAGDVGEFVARKIRSRGSSVDGNRMHFLVSSRGTSILEVKRKVEWALKVKLNFRYNQGFGNSSNITFSERVLPPGWMPASLEVGIRRLLLDRLASTSISRTVVG